MGFEGVSEEIRTPQARVWLLLDERERFLPFQEFPWLKHAAVEATPGHLYRPDLDIDLAVESIEHPERLSLPART